jgi:hypothetical protein
MTLAIPVVVRVFGVPAAPGCPADQTWEAVTWWLAAQLAGRFGAQVQTEYVNLFGSGMTRFPEVTALVTGGAASPPIVTVDGTVVSAGGKVSVPAVRKTLEALGLRPGVAPGGGTGG